MFSGSALNSAEKSQISKIALFNAEYLLLSNPYWLIPKKVALFGNEKSVEDKL